MGNLQKQAKQIAEAIVDLRDEFKAALVSKGVADPGDNMSDYPSKILDIPAGGSGRLDWMQNRVRFFDFDGTLVYETTVNDGESVTAPAGPDHTRIGLTFTRWGCNAADLTAVYSNLDIVALYDGEFSAMFKVTAKAGDTVVLPIVAVSGASAAPSAAIDVDWGNGREVAAGYPSKTFAEDFDGYVRCWVMDQQDPLTYAAFKLDESVSGMHYDISEVIIGHWVDETGVAVDLTQHGFDVFMVCDNAGPLVDYSTETFTITMGYQVGGPLRILILPDQTKVNISGFELVLLSVPELTTIAGLSSLKVPVLYVPAVTDLPNTYGYVFVDTFAATACASLNISTYWGDIQQVWFGAATANGSLSPARAWYAVKKATIKMAAGVSELGFSLSNALSLQKVTIIGGESTLTVVRSWPASLREVKFDIPDTGDNLLFSGSSSVSMTSPYLLDMDWWEEFIGQIGSTSFTLYIAANVYQLMPEELMNLATSKGISLAEY